MEIATNFEAIMFRLRQSGYIATHLNANSWLRQLPKLLQG